MANITLYANKDTYIDSNQPTINFGGDAFSIFGSSGGGIKKRAFLSFDLSSIPNNAIITSAKLYMYESGWDYGHYDTLTFDIYRITSAWVEGSVTWNTQPSYEAAPSVTGLSMPYAASDMWKNYTITSLISELIEQGNDSIMLRSQSESGVDQKAVFSGANVPYLSITYTVPLQVYDGSAWKTVSNIKVYDGSAWKDVVGVKVHDGVEWKDVF